MTGALFVDLKKAFGTVPHKELISKLESFGFVDNSIAWFTNYLSNRSQVVSLGTNLSSPLAVLNGVPQGSILGPVLFTLYINDLPSCINFSNVIMYADDTVIFFFLCTIDGSGAKVKYGTHKSIMQSGSVETNFS